MNVVRNDGLELRGLKMNVSFSKYQKAIKKVQKTHGTFLQNKDNLRKNLVWKPANRDSRSYKEVVKDIPMVEGEASITVSENLKVSFICSKDSVLEMAGRIEEKIK